MYIYIYVININICNQYIYLNTNILTCIHTYIYTYIYMCSWICRNMCWNVGLVPSPTYSWHTNKHKQTLLSHLLIDWTQDRNISPNLRINWQPAKTTQGLSSPQTWTTIFSIEIWQTWFCSQHLYNIMC